MKRFSSRLILRLMSSIYRHPALVQVVLLVLCFGLPNSNATAQTYFYNRVTYATGNYPAGVVIADFNGDGRMDLAIVNTDDSTVSIFLGKPDGTFAPRNDIATASGPEAVAAGDFNGDGKMDLAIANYGNTASILLGNGDGTFRTEGEYPTGVFPLGVTVSDFNHDGKADLAVLNYNCVYPNPCGAASISVLLGNGDGSFQPKTDFGIPASPNSIIAADLRGSGEIDLVVTCFTLTPTATNFVSVLLGNGDGTFRAHVDYVTGYAPNGVAAADFNGDGKIDLVVATTFDPSLLLGNGDGTFQAPQPITLPFGVETAAYAVLAADLNHDGKMDFVIANGSVAASGVSVFLGNGDGTFQTEVDYLANHGQGDLALGDVNGDGALDVVLLDWSGAGTGPPAANTVTVLLGNGDGTFSPRVALPALPPYESTNWTAEGAVFGDFNGDGKLDLLVTEDNAAYTPNEAAQVFFPGNGDGTLGTPVLNNLAGGFLAAADFNGDGKLDLLLAPTYGLSVALGNGDGTFGTPNRFFNISGFSVQGAVTGDFNHDGKTDVVVLASENPPIYVFLGNGNGTFLELPPFWSVPPSPQAVIAADFNHDGNLDLAITLSASGVNSLAVMLGNGDGTFQAPVYYPTDDYPGGIAVGDFNGDGIPDLVVTAYQADVYLGNGDGTFKAPVYYNAGSFPRFVVTGDFNGDGNVDLAVVDDLYLSILLGNGDGTFQAPVSVNDNSYLYAPAVGDLNQDGVTDIYTGFGTGSVFLSKPLVSVFPGSLNFAAQDIGTESAPATLTLTNVGLGGLSLTNLLATGGFGATNGCMGKINHGVQCTIDVTFAPTSPGPAQGTLTLIDNTPTGSQSIPLAGVATAPAVALSSTSLTFASQATGTTSAAQTVTLTNSGNGALTIASITISGDFSQDDTCGSNVDAGANCAINITFTPTSAGTRTGTLTITDNASNSPQTVSLTGIGTAPSVSLSSTSVSFGNQGAGTTSTASAVTVNNTGTAPLTFTGIAASGDFAIAASGTTCSTSSPIAAGGSCLINLTFTPTVNGSRSGSLTLTDNASGSPQTVSLTGTGTGPVVSLSSALSFSSQLVGNTSSSQTVTLTNTGSASLTLTAISASAPFAVAATGTTCATSTPVAASGSCTVAVTFTPTAGGAASGSLSFTDNAPGSPHSVALSGTGQDFTITVPSGSSSTESTAPGEPATYTFTVGGLGGFSSAVSSTCAGAPSEATCTVSPNPLPAGSTTVTVTVTTTAASVVAPRSRPLPPAPPSAGLRYLLLLGAVLLMAAWAIGRARVTLARPRLATLVPLIAGVLLMLALAGCGGGGGGGGGTTSNPGTPAGTYTLTVTGTTGSGSSTVSHSMTLTLTVT